MGSEGHRAAWMAVAILVAALVAAAGMTASAAAATERIYTVAGAGFVVRNGVAVAPPTGDGGPAALARIAFPTAVAATADGGFLIAEGERHRIRRVSPRGVITTLAGTGRGGLSGDGGAATRARIDFPTGVAPLADGAVAIADQRNNRVRLVDAAGVITTLAAVTSPDGVAAAAGGGVLVVQDLENRVLHVDRAGVATVVAGSGARGFSGDGGPAVAARLSRPAAVATTGDGGFLVADGSNRVQRVGPDGTIVTVAGTGRGNFSGDGGPARRAALWLPGGVAPAAGGGVVVADTVAGRVRFIDSADPGPAPGPATPRVLAASFARAIQRGDASGVTRVRVACPPRLVAVRFAVSRPATVSLAVSRAGRPVARLGARLAAGAHVLRFRVNRTGSHVLRLTAAGGLGRTAHDQALLSVNRCGR